MYSKLFPNEYLRLGALTITHLGTLSRSPYMHNRNYLFPEQYRSFRIYWSTQSIGEVGLMREWKCSELCIVWKFYQNTSQMINQVFVVLYSVLWM